MGVQTVIKTSGNYMDPARLFKMHAQFQTIPTSTNMGILSPVLVLVQAPTQPKTKSSALLLTFKNGYTGTFGKIKSK